MYAALKEMKHKLADDYSDASYYHKLCCIIQEAGNSSYYSYYSERLFFSFFISVVTNTWKTWSTDNTKVASFLGWSSFSL